MKMQWKHAVNRVRVLVSLCIVFCLSAALLVACVSTEDLSDDGLSTLSFNDANFVSGLDFVNGDNTGVTNALGQFSFDPSENISFSIGDIDLGTIDPSTIGSNTMIDTSFFDAFNVGSMTSEIGNISQFLQSLDDDADFTNGISIPSSVSSAASSMSIDFDQSASTFESTYQTDINTLTSSTTAGERDFVSRSASEQNFQNYLDYGQPASSGSMTCEDATFSSNCNSVMACAPPNPLEDPCYYEADGARWYFDCMDTDATTDAAQAVVNYCTE